VPAFVNRRNVLRRGAGAAAAALVGPGLVAASLPAAAQQNAAELVQRTAAQVLDLVMTKTGAAREAGILRVLQTDFDLDYMARFTLGVHWNKASPEQRERLYFNLVVPPEIARQMARHSEQLDLNYSKSAICCQHQGSHFGKTRFATGPRPGEEALDARALMHGHRATTLFELLRGPKHTLLLFPGAYHEATSWHRLMELAKSVDAAVGDLINTFFVAAEAASIPSDLRPSERVVLDPERSLHYRYGAETECLYLVRPDGYVGYRSEPATASALHDYLRRIFIL